MNAKELIDSLFKGYEETAALADFKEELLGNLNAKIESFTKKGMDAQAAFAKASAELGDVSALANELSLKKRKEVFEEVYMDTRKYMTVGRVAAYVVFGALAFFGVTVAGITFFATKTIGLNEHLDMSGFFGAMMPFLVAASIGFTWLGVTQETASMYPVSKKRGVWYAAAAGLIAFGLFTMPIVFFSAQFVGDAVSSATIPLAAFTNSNFQMLVPVISLMIPFVLPGIGLLVFLVLTEKDRNKPWVKDFRNKTIEQEMALWNDPAMATRFGLLSGAIWIFAFGLFFLFGFLIGFKFSWLVFVFAVAIQLLVQALMIKRK